MPGLAGGAPDRLSYLRRDRPAGLKQARAAVRRGEDDRLSASMGASNAARDARQIILELIDLAHQALILLHAHHDSFGPAVARNVENLVAQASLCNQS